jgi:hypothetical protein
MICFKKHELKFIELARKGYYKILESGEIFRTMCRFCGSECFKKVAFYANKGGYRGLRFRYNGKYQNAFVHRIVYSFFKGEIPDGFLINHIDGDPGNNDLSNLEAVSPRDNFLHAVNILKTNKSFGPGYPPAPRLTPMDVARIHYFHNRKIYTDKELAAKFGVTTSHIYDICKLKQWRSLFDKKYTGKGYIFLLSPGEAERLQSSRAC